MGVVWGEQFAELPEAEELKFPEHAAATAGGFLIPASLVDAFLEAEAAARLSGSFFSHGAMPVGLLQLPEKQEDPMSINDPEAVAKAFNRWLDDYEKHPAKFAHTIATVKKHLEEKAAGKTPSYGQECVEILNHYLEHEELPEAVEAAG